MRGEYAEDTGDIDDVSDEGTDDDMGELKEDIGEWSNDDGD